jgi:hypothetical protein
MDLKVAVGVCYGRSGSFFLHSLLDGHPEILCLPPYLMNLAQQIMDTIEIDDLTFAKQFTQDFKNLFVATHEQCICNRYINLANNMVRTQTGLLNLNPREFLEFIRPEFDNTTNRFKSRFLAVHMAIYRCLNIDISNKKVIFYQLHTPDYRMMRKIRDNFGHLWVCHSVRDPISTFARACMAHIFDLQKMDSYQTQVGVNLVESCFRQFLYAGVDLVDQENSSGIAIKLEDLHEHPARVLTAVCKFLGIAWHDILMKETINHGQNWGGIVGDTTGFNLPKTLKNNHRYRDIFDEFDLIRLEKIARQRLLKWDYPRYYDDRKDKLDFEAPYTFEKFAYGDPNTAKTDCSASNDQIISNRGSLHSAILKTLNYLPEMSAPYAELPYIE